MNAPVETLVSFLPTILIEDLQRRGALPSVPVAQPLSAAVLFADVTGFTSTTEKLAKRGPEGAELVTRYIERVFEPLLSAIADRGGDVLGFAGDSITAIWHDETGDLGAAVLAAAACALELERRVATMSRDGEQPVQLTVGVGAGEASLLQLGGHQGRWKYLVVGAAIEQVEQTHLHAEPGQVIVSDRAAELAGELVTVRSRGRDDNLLIRTSEPAVIQRGRALAEEPVSVELLTSYIPEPVLDSFEGGQLRIISAIFIRLLELDVTGERDRDALNGAVAAIQHVLDRFEGTFLHIAADDKGLSVAVSFGLPPQAYEEDAARACQAALEIEAELRTMRIEYGVGIATGPAYCGIYGTDVHREFTSMGSVMNLAARLMQAARNAITTDEATVKATHGRIRFSEQPAVVAKGIEEPVAAFRPLWEEDLTQRSLALLAKHATVAIVGREQEMATLANHLDLLESGTSSTVVLEGEPGIGKSILAADLIAAAGRRDVQALFGTGDAVERNTPYHAWRPVFESLLDLESIVDGETRRARVRERLEEWPDTAQLAPLLNAIVDLGFPETTVTRALTGSVRRDGIDDLVIALLRDASTRTPILLVIDDVHWMDSASWELLRRVRRNVDPLLLVMATWPSARTPELSELLEEPETELVPIGRMPPELTIDLVKEKLGVTEVSERVAALINEKAEGQPYFSEEIAYTLCEEGVIAIDGGRATLTTDAGNIDGFEVPDTIHGVITSRLSRLAPEESRTLKVASVLGPRFNPELLRIIHPGHPAAAELQDHLQQLERLGLIAIEADGSAGFRHSIIHSVAYDMSERRRAIHESIANWYEANHGGEDWAHSVIAHHWEGAEQPDRALPFLELAGSAALEQGASSEAEHFFVRVIEIGGATVDEPGRAAHWWTQLGQARAEMGELTSADDAYHTGLGHLGNAIPRSTPARIVRLLWESVIQVGHLLSISTRVKDPVEAVRTAQAARICSLIGELYFFTGDQVGFPLLNLMSINRAERSRRHESAGLAYSSLSYLVGVMRLRALEARYHERARMGEAADAGSDEAGGRWIVPLGPAHRVAAANSHASFLMGYGHWAEAFPTLAEGIETARKLRDFYTLEIGLTLRAVGHLQVSPLDDAALDVAEALESSRDRSNVQHEVWALGLQSIIHLRRGETEAALQAAEAAAPLALADARFVDPTTVPLFHAARAVTRCRLGDVDPALDDIRQVLGALELAPVFANIHAYQAAMESLFSLWEAPGVDATRHRRRVRRAMSMLRRFAVVFPFARTTYALYRGRYHFARGRTGRARRAWQRGLARSVETDQAWDEARLHRWLAETSAVGSRDREEHLENARSLFQRLGAAHELADLDRVEGA